jgi:hypothetical protein
MIRARRLVAIATALVVAWTALWPLVSSARALLAHQEVVLCHQAGSMVEMGEAPMPLASAPGAPAPASNDGTHCPLCVMAFYGSAAQPIAVPPLQFSTLSVRVDVYSAPRPFNLQVPLPPSRAPPFAAA